MVTYCDLNTGENCLTDSIKRQSGLERIVMESAVPGWRAWFLERWAGADQLGSGHKTMTRLGNEDVQDRASLNH